MTEKMRRHFLKAKDAEALLDMASEKLKIGLKELFKTRANVEVVQTEFAEIYLINNKPVLAKVGEKVFPTLIFDEFLASAPRVRVDMGAIPHVCNGANVMAPGIRRFEGDFREGDFVLIVDDRHGKSLALGEAVYDADKAKKTTHGVVVENVHYVGDKVWNFLKKV